MISVSRLVFNAFMVNTYLLHDESRECVIIDPGCVEPGEKKELEKFLSDNGLVLVRNINTHCHIDHILGNGFIAEKYNVRPEYHRASGPFFFTAKEIARSFGYSLDHIPEPSGFIEDGDLITFGRSGLSVLYTPGHADGSVCFYSQSQDFVITGDVIFRESIGRTDLPTGNLSLLMRSIKDKLFTLPDKTAVYPGHGPESTIGYEKMNNPFTG